MQWATFIRLKILTTKIVYEQLLCMHSEIQFPKTKLAFYTYFITGELPCTPESESVICSLYSVFFYPRVTSIETGPSLFGQFVLVIIGAFYCADPPVNLRQALHVRLSGKHLVINWSSARMQPLVGRHWLNNSYSHSYHKLEHFIVIFPKKINWIVKYSLRNVFPFDIW